jgi:hypothetical protein
VSPQMAPPATGEEIDCSLSDGLVYSVCTVQTESLGDPSATDVDADAARLPGAFFF